MAYVDNLLDWGDACFTQNTWESITQATTLYFLAAELLGPKPQQVGLIPSPAPQSFHNIEEDYNNNIKEIPQFLIELENKINTNTTQTKPELLGSNPVLFNDLNDYFCVPENSQFAHYWSRVQDRLYKIQHCENLKGVVQQLSLFSPPINPSQLVQAAAAGGNPLSITSVNTQVPYYRFTVLLQRAKDITATVTQLGATLLGILEKQDAEALSLLQSSQQVALLHLITQTKQQQIEVAKDSLAALQASLKSAQYRQQHYQDLIAKKLLPTETKNLSLAGDAVDSQSAAEVIHGIAIAAYLVPCVFGFSDGGMKFGDAVNMGAAIADTAAGIHSQNAAIAATNAQYQRRGQDWQLQLQLAADDIIQIQAHNHHRQRPS